MTKYEKTLNAEQERIANILEELTRELKKLEEEYRVAIIKYYDIEKKYSKKVCDCEIDNQKQKNHFEYATKELEEEKEIYQKDIVPTRNKIDELRKQITKQRIIYTYQLRGKRLDIFQKI